MRITEYMYQGANGEFVEFTNVGETPIDMSGWSFDDDSALPGTVPLGDFGVVRPGESVIMTDVPADAFRKAWGLCAETRILVNAAVGLGRNDVIHLYDGNDALVDRLAFGDQTFPGSFRTQNISAWVPASALGGDNVLAWVASTLGDAEDSRTSTGGDLGSPGLSTRAAHPFSACVTLGGIVRITEYMYQGTDGEFIEFTNVGDQPVDMAGWSFDDDSNLPGSVPLGAFGSLQAGESVLLTDVAADAFRTAWGLCDGVKVIGMNPAGLGRNDVIHLYDADGEPVDRLAYGDQTFPGAFRTQNVSAWAPASALGADTILGWVASTLDDAEDSRRSLGLDLASPGTSARVVRTYDPCVGTPGAPLLTVDAATTSIHLDLAVNGSGAASGVIGDPTDPLATVGIGFTVAPGEGGDLGAIEVSVTSSRDEVVDAAGLLLTGEGDARQLRIVPHGVGHADISVRAATPTGDLATYVIRYAASAAAPVPADATFPTGSSDASATAAVDATTMFVADDEGQVLRLFARDRSGLALTGFDFTSSLGLTDTSGGQPREVDLEAVARRGDRLYWIGSHGNSKDGELRPNRQRVFATDLAGRGALASLAYAGRYDHLRTDLLAWDAANGHGLGANALGFAAATAVGMSPDLVDGFNIEGLVLAPDGDTVYLAFRAPLLPIAARTHALLVPVLDFDALVTGATPGSLPAGSATFGTPILLDLGGRGVRSVDRNADGDYVVTAGPPGVATGVAPSNFRLFGWDGRAEGQTFPLGYDLATTGNTGSYESLVEVPTTFGAQTVLQLVADNGETVWYADGIVAKDLAEKRHAKFRVDTIRVPMPTPRDVLFIDGMDGR